MKPNSSTIKAIINEAKKGKMFILVDNKDRKMKVTWLFLLQKLMQKNKFYG